MAQEDDVARLVAVLEADLRGFTKGMDQAQKIADAKFGALEKRMNQTETAFLKGFSGLGDAARTLGLALSGPALVSWTAGVVKSTADLENQAKVLGISTDALQAYHAAAVQSGASADVGDAAIRRFTRSIGDAQAGTKQQADAFAALGISGQDLFGGTESVLPRAAAALLEISDASTRARLETELFGRSGQDVEQVLRKWADPEIIGNMRKTGLVIDDELVKRAADADRAWNLFWLHFKADAADVLLGDKGPAWANQLVAFLDQFDPSIAKGPANFAPSASDLAGIAANAAAQHAAAARAGIPFDPSKLAQQIDVTGSQFGSGKTSNALDDFLAKLQTAAQIARETAEQRQIDGALIDAATAKLRDQGIAELVVVSSVQQARDILGEQTAEQIAQLEHQTALNTLYGEGATRLEQIRQSAGNVTWNDRFIAGLDELSRSRIVDVLQGARALSRSQVAPDLATAATENLVEKVKEQAAASALLPQYRAAELAIVQLEYEKQVKLTDEQKQQIVNAYELAQATKDVVEAEREMQSTFADWLLQVEQTGQFNFRKLFAGVLEDWEKLLDKMIAQQAFQALFGNGTGGLIGGAIGSVLGFADGGVMTSRGSVPLRRYAGGGVARTPQLAMFGEGSGAEAYVPLPDGRSIPVSLRMPQLQPAAQAINVTIVNQNSFDGAIDAKSMKAYADQVGAVSAASAVQHIKKQFPGLMVKAQRDNL